jgi:hypothetical protein
MKAYLLLSLCVFSACVLADVPGTFSTEISIESRYFGSNGAYDNHDRRQFSVRISPEYVLAWNNDRSVLTIEPFWRFDSMDDERSHADIRELSFVSSGEHLELRLGISRVFWGVTESRHLVDVINQTDGVENPDGEEKLGQPMINATLVGAVGNLDLFLLPVFRERTFSGRHGRYRGPQEIENRSARYTHGREDKHLDYAVKWSGYWRELDWGLSYFRGTDREPVFRPGDSGKTVPVYGQSRQVGLELQHIYRDLITKAEFRYKESDLASAMFSSTIGFEFTFYGAGPGSDIGVLYELLWDTGGENPSSGIGVASFVGARVALNDTQSSRALVGAVINHRTTRLSAFRVEASRRMTGRLNVELEMNLIADPPAASALQQVEKDSYVQVTLSAFLY